MKCALLKISLQEGGSWWRGGRFVGETFLNNCLASNLGRIIPLEKIIQKYSVFVLLFGTQIGSKQASLFVSYKKWIPFLKLNNVEYCQIVVI